MDSMAEPPRYLSWQRHEGMPGTCGSFGSGTTIQLAAPEDSAYLNALMIETREILPANSNRNIGLLYQWLHGCINNPEHSECMRSLTGIHYDDSAGEILPSRVIHVGSLDGREPARLFITNGEKDMYTALSHRWGKGQKVKTLKTDLESFSRSLPMDELPLTFRDAIQVTRNLGIFYLWIDSLCIVQDNPEDWAKEATQMGSIFERATCTIAAIDAIDDTTDEDRGLFNLRQPDPLAVRMSCKYNDELDEPPTYDDEEWEDQLKRLPCSFASVRNKDIILQPRWKGLLHTMVDSAWYNRGWVVKERVLSRRIIYYTRRKIFWECQKLSNDEENRPNNCPSLRSQFATRLDQLATRTLPMDPNQTFHNLDIWNTQIAEYSACRITFETDKLVAFQGICDRVEKRLNRTIFAGMLLDGTGFNLLWRSRDEKSTIYTKFHAPSWSWAACNGAVSYYDNTITGQLAPQLQELKVDSPPSCLHTDDGTKCRNGVCGIMSFSTTFGSAIAEEKINELRSKSNDSLIHILGSTVHLESIPVPRQTSGGSVLNIPDRKLSLPKQTQVLRDVRTGDIIGWFANDRDVPSGKQQEILCANVAQWKASKMSKGFKDLNPVRKFDYDKEENVDFIALEPCGGSAGFYRRIGRGRVVRKGWLDSCGRKFFKVV
ncbi:HET-domain-containing protein [Acephala macrosclerotiorum]|nr:HET-domain-containing protein [Acephala macrosclerotiorum]